MSAQAAFCATLADEWARCGVTDVVIAPGSRSTPLVLALAANARFSLHVFLDERSAGFFALGVGLATGVPAVVVTTSGTAAAELHACVVEASQAGVPLLACTADRPPEAHGYGSPQTIEQSGLYPGVLRWRAEPGVPDPAASGAWRSLASRAFAEASGAGGRPGPVHLNLAFREPLVGEAGPLPPPRDAGLPWSRSTGRTPAPAADPSSPAAPSPAAASPAACLARAFSGRRGVVVAGDMGVGAGEETAQQVLRLAGMLGWPVLADPRSGCRLAQEGVVAAFDPMLRHAAFREAMAPEVVLRLGSPPASRVLAEWVASCGAEVVVGAPAGTWPDPEHVASEVVACDPGALCGAVAAAAPAGAPAGWAAAWGATEAAAQRAIDGVIAADEALSEPAAARELVACLPEGAALLASSSMPVRDVEWYARPRSGVRFFANRGANGIDGVVSTALGIAASGLPTAALLGDLAFLHDCGGLVGAAARRLSCVLVVLDNDGGGIFSFLPQAREMEAALFERLFATPHGSDLAAVARAHGVPVTTAARRGDLARSATAALGEGGVHVLVVRGDRRANVEVHEALSDAVAAALEQVLRSSRP